MISGSASGSSTRHSSWRSVRPIPRPASFVSVGHVVEPGDDVAEDDQQRVGDERDDRRRVAAAGDRQQQEEDRDAGDRVEDAGDLSDGGDQPAAPVGEQRERERDQRSRSPTDDQRQVDVLEERVDVAVEVVGDPARAEAVVRRRSVSLACARGSATWASSGDQQSHRAPLRGARSSAPRRARGTRDDLDREHAGDAPARVDDRRRTAPPCWSRSDERVAQDVVELEDGSGARVGARRRRARLRGRARRASRAGGRSASTSSGVRDLRSVELRPHLGRRLADAHERRLPEVDVAHALQRQPLERPVGADEVLDERVGRVPSAARPAVAYWASLPPFCRIAIRSPILIASSMSWVTKTIGLAELAPGGAGTRSGGARG